MPAARLRWPAALTFFALAAGLDVVMARGVLGPILAGDLYGPDSYMRMLRLRETLEQHRAVYAIVRDGIGAPTVLHWSHLLDSLLLLMATPLRLIASEPSALHIAAVAFGPMTVGALGVALAWVLAPLTASGWRWTAPALAGVSAPIVDYGLPGVVHHHILLAIAAVMVAGWAARALEQGAPAGLRVGLWGAVGLWLSPETMPFILAAFGALGLGFLQGRASAVAGLRAGGSALLLAVVAMVLVDPPFDGFAAVHVERLSIVYVGLGVVVAAIGWSIWAIDRTIARPAVRIVLALLAVAICLGGWIAMFPSVAKGPDGLMRPEEAKAMFSAIAEMRPIQGAADATVNLATGALATLVLLAVAWRRSSWLWLYAAACGAATVALGAWHIRFATYPACFGAAVLPLSINLASDAFAPVSPNLQSLARVATVAVFLLLPSAGPLMQASTGGPAEASVADTAPPCRLRDAASLLAPYAGQVVLADPSDTPELLYRTDIRTVGSLYMNVAGYMAAWSAWRSPPSEDVPPELRATRATLILVCPDLRVPPRRSSLVSDLPPRTLLDRLQRNNAPIWLHRVGSEAGGYVLYAISGNPT